MWGQGILTSRTMAQSRIIPTRVGTRFTLTISERTCGDHPHACGDKPLIKTSREFNLGSSPRVWGQDFLPSSNCNIFGIIPTRVGTRRYLFAAVASFQDHPHACGDKLERGDKLKENKGSSPRVWGQAELTLSVKSVAGSIPTRVGTRKERR